MDGGQGREVVVVRGKGSGFSGWGCLKGPSDGTCVLAGFVTSTHDIVFVLLKIMVKVDVVGPNPPLI